MSLSNSSDAYAKAADVCLIMDGEIELETLHEKKILQVLPTLNYLRVIESHCSLIRRLLSERITCQLI